MPLVHYGFTQNAVSSRCRWLVQPTWSSIYHKFSSQKWFFVLCPKERRGRAVTTSPSISELSSSVRYRKLARSRTVQVGPPSNVQSYVSVC